MKPLLEPVHFLLVDDLSENLLALEGLLRREGLVLLKAKSGPEALELLLQHDVALALVDVQMPGMNGFDLAELMRGTERTKSVPIIFVTAGAHDQQRRFMGYEAGAVDFIHKPIEPDILRSKAAVFFDLYRQRQAVARQRDELRAATEENTRLLKEARRYADALEEADRRKDEFVATLAHELRNPLAPIRTGLQILKMDAHSENADEVRDMMDRQLNHMVRMIDDLLDISRISQGKIELRKEKVNIQSVVDSALETSRPLLDVKSHKLTLDLPDADLWIDADFTRVSQIISNILNNAAKYTPDGGEIRLEVRKERSEVVIRVKDNGAGIPREMLHRIFELFTQINRTQEQSQGGLGIGLALVKHLVGLHGGEIMVESEGMGKGSTFTVRLPAAAAMPQSAEAEQDAPDFAATSLKVLVVDDNEASAKTTGWMLEMIGHQPVLAHTGPDALDMARAQRPDVIVLDIGLPGMDGYSVCRELRKDPQFKHTVLIAQTGWGQQRDRELAHEAGFDHHLVKPVEFQKFSELLGNIRAA